MTYYHNNHDYYKDIVRGMNVSAYKCYSMIMNELLINDLEKSVGDKIFQISAIRFDLLWDTLFWSFFTKIPSSILQDEKMPQYRIVRLIGGQYPLDLLWKIFFSTQKNKKMCDLLAVNASYNNFKSMDPILKACSSDYNVDVIFAGGSWKGLPIYMKNSQYNIIRYFYSGKISDYLKVYRVAIFLTYKISVLRKIFKKHLEGYSHKEIDYSTWLFVELIIRAVHDYIFTRRIIIEKKPSCVIVSNDHRIFPRCTIVNANQLGIPTFHYPHAVMNTTWAYSNIRARKIFVGGNAEKKYLLSIGYKDRDVIISGRNIDYSSNITDYNMISIFLTNYQIPHYHQSADDLVKQILDAFPDYNINLQTHPIENIEHYPGIKAMIASQKISRSMTYENQETLKTSFINIVPYNSNICLDSICHGKLTVAYNLFDAMPSIPWEQYGACLFSRTAQEVISNVHKIKDSPELREKLRKGCNKMKKDYFSDISKKEHIKLVLESISKELNHKNQ